MLKRVFSKALLASSATAAAAIALGVGAVVPAQASVARQAMHGVTPMCLASSFSCYTPRLDGEVTPTLGQALEVSPSAVRLSGAAVVVAAYDDTSVGQDWNYVDYGAVGSYLAGGGFGLTAFDFGNYASDELFALEFTPAGIPSGYCAANVSDRMVLRTCNGSVFQTFFYAHSLPGGLNAPGILGVSWAYYLSVAQVKTSVHHYAATGSRLPGAQVYFTTARTTVDQWWGKLVVR